MVPSLTLQLLFYLFLLCFVLFLSTILFSASVFFSFPDYHCCSVTKSCPILCKPMNCRTPGSSVLHYLLEFAQIYVPLSLWCYLPILSSAAPLSFCLQSFPASGSFPVSGLFVSGGQSIGASATVLPMDIQD